MDCKLYNDDCYEILKQMPEKSIDLILCDMPYGTTKCKFDKKIDLPEIWRLFKNVAKKNAAIVLFSAMPFTVDLINAQRELFRYEIIWKKTQKSGFLNAKKMPMRQHENILIFYQNKPTYNPQFTKSEKAQIGRSRKEAHNRCELYNSMGQYEYVDTGKRYPTDVIEFSNWNRAIFGDNSNCIKHPTSKPVDLLEYLIKTYSNEGDTILDCFMGSGSTGVACANTGRDFVGVEIDEEYFNYAQDRILTAIKQQLDSKNTTEMQGQMTLFD